MLHWTQVWKHMRSLTNMDIEKRAVMEFINYFERQMDLVIEKSLEALDRRNRFYRIQGLRQKRRIDSECIREAIKNINNGGNPSMPERAGGRKKEGKNYEMHTPEHRKTRRVEVT